jgi:hypothetical protein
MVSLAGRRWGPAVSGWIIGLPLTSGPVSLFLALDHGTAFASRAAEGSLLGLISLAAFCLTYSWLSVHINWPVSILAGWGAFFALTFALQFVSVPLFLSFVGVIACFLLVLQLLPGSQSLNIATKSPRWETPLRMVVAAAFVIVLTGTAGVLGPQLSGLLTPFPVFATILAIFTHHFHGANAARILLRGLISGAFSFAVFFLVIAGLIDRWGIVAAFALATLAALTMHGVSLFMMRRKSTAQ